MLQNLGNWATSRSTFQQDTAFFTIGLALTKHGQSDNPGTHSLAANFTSGVDTCTGIVKPFNHLLHAKCPPSIFCVWAASGHGRLPGTIQYMLFLFCKQQRSTYHHTVNMQRTSKMQVLLKTVNSSGHTQPEHLQIPSAPCLSVLIHRPLLPVAAWNRNRINNWYLCVSPTVVIPIWILFHHITNAGCGSHMGVAHTYCIASRM